MADAKRQSRIDVHHHFYAPEYLSVMGDMAKRPVVRDWSVDRSIEEMDKNGVGTAVLSLSPPGIHHVGNEAARKLARAVNEHAAKMRGTHPTRFGHFASVPMPDIDGTLSEIAYALDVLKADGIQFMTSYGERYPGHPDFEPVMEELNRRKALVFVHPLAPICCAPSLAGFSLRSSNSRKTPTAASSASSSRGHWRAGPTFASSSVIPGPPFRCSRGAPRSWGWAASLPTRCRTGSTMSCASSITTSHSRRIGRRLRRSSPTYRLSQVLLGSDYPFGTSGDGIRGLEEYGLKPGELAAIYRGNAARLIPRLGA